MHKFRFWGISMNTEQKRSAFNRLFSTQSFGATGECHCGISHCDIAGNWDCDHSENTVPVFIEMETKEPTKYQCHDSAIEYCDFNGHLYVVGCQCKMDEFMFNFLAEEKQRILRFYLNTKDQLEVSDVI